MRLDTDKIKTILKQIADSKLPYLELSAVFNKYEYKEDDADYATTHESIYLVKLLYENHYIYFESNINAVNNGCSVSTLPSTIYSDKSYDDLFLKNYNPDENTNYIFIGIYARAYLTYEGYQLLDSLENNSWMHSVKNVLGEMSADTIKKLPFSLISSVIKTSLS
jgi:hypothetical protein